MRRRSLHETVRVLSLVLAAMLAIPCLARAETKIWEWQSGECGGGQTGGWLVDQVITVAPNTEVRVVPPSSQWSNGMRVYVGILINGLEFGQVSYPVERRRLIEAGGTVTIVHSPMRCSNEFPQWPGIITFTPQGQVPAGPLFEASLRNGDYGTGAIINTFPPNHGGSPGVPGIVGSDAGVTFTATETDGRSNALVNWVIPSADRVPFRTAGTVSFCFSADRASQVDGWILGENKGFGAWNNGQGSFGASLSRLPNGEGIDDDQVTVTLASWHNNVWFYHGPSLPFEYGRVYRVGFAWGLTSTLFEIWLDGQLVELGDSSPYALPWGADYPDPSATNLGLGDNHQRGVDGYGSAAGVTFADIRVWKGYQPLGDTVDGCPQPNPNPNGPPVAANDLATTPDGAPAIVAVLANDTDPDGDPLQITGVTNGSLGTTAINADGTVTYTSNIVGGLPARLDALPLGDGQRNSLSRKLAAARRSFARGNSTAGRNQLGALLNELEAVVQSGRLDPAAVEALYGSIQVWQAGGALTDQFTYTIDDGKGGVATATVIITIAF